MDFSQSAAFFDLQNFDAYNFNTGSWASSAFKGQMKRADDFVSIWNRPTRKRMLFTHPDEEITSSVIRVPSTGEIFMVAHTSGDTFKNVHYRNLSGLHQVLGTAVHRRKTPVVTAGVKGWAVESVVRNTFADFELRSVNESQEMQQLNYGSYFMFMPSDTYLQRHDTVELNSKRYYVLEPYLDSGLVCARVSLQPDERVNFVYTSKGAPSYNTSTQSVTSVDTPYNVTGKITPFIQQDLKNSDVIKDRVKVMILESFISFTPKINDVIAYLGTSYRVEIVQRDASLEEWVLVASS